MKKCGIITYHFAVNYGAMLQCYALKMALLQQGYDARVINFISDQQKDNNSLYRKNQGIKGYIKNVVLLPFHMKRNRRQKRIISFMEQRLGCGKRIKSIAELSKYVENEAFDTIISGSDQVWNPRIKDFNDAFFYPFYTQAKKIGYAISIGGAGVSELRGYKSWIDQFATITVREKSTIPVLNQIVDKSIKEVVDPVFLLSPAFWKKQCTRTNRNRPYLICYFVKGEQLSRKVEIAKTIAKSKGLELIVINPRITRLNLTEKVIGDAGPIEFISVINDAEFVFTDSFHGTAFSLLLGKEFITIESSTEHADSRKKNLLMNVGLYDRIHNIANDYYERLPIDYESVYSRLTNMRKDSLNLVLSCIED